MSWPHTLTPGSQTCSCFWTQLFWFITSAKGGYVFTSVCLSVRRITEKLWTDFDEISWRGRHGPGTNEFNFGDDPDHHPDPGVRSPKSEFTGLSKKLPTDFDEILRRAGLWPRDQLNTFWWRSGSLSGSGSPFRIREERPRCQHTHTHVTEQMPPVQSQWVQFWWRSGSPSGSRSPKSEIRIHSIIDMLAFGGGLCSLSTFSWCVV